MTLNILFAAKTTELCLLLFRIETLLEPREYHGKYIASSLNDGCPVN